MARNRAVPGITAAAGDGKWRGGLGTVCEIVYEGDGDASLNTAGDGTINPPFGLFGADAGFFATVQDPELRAGLSTDLGRKRQIGWVGTIEAGLTWDLAATARVLEVTSA